MISFSDIKVENKIAVCYTCTTRILREITLWQLTNKWFDNDNVYYFIITDDKSTFENCDRKNLTVNTVDEFEVHPIEQLNSGHPHSFSLMRFHLQQIKPYNITSFGLFCCDTIIREGHYFDSSTFSKVINGISSTPYLTFVHCGVGEIGAQTGIIRHSDVNEDYQQTYLDSLKFLKSAYNWEPKTEYILIFDGAARFFNFKETNEVDLFFEIWDYLIHEHYKDLELIKKGGNIVNDEYILSPLYDMMGLKWDNNSTNNYLPFESHHLLSLLYTIPEATIDLNKSLEENFKTYFKDEEYVIS